MFRLARIHWAEGKQVGGLKSRNLMLEFLHMWLFWCCVHSYANSALCISYLEIRSTRTIKIFLVDIDYLFGDDWMLSCLFSYSKCSFCFRFAIMTATWKFEVVNVTRFTFSASSDISHFYFGCTLWFKSFFIFWSKCISSCLKNALNWSKVKVKAFIMLQNTSKSNKCYLLWTFYSSRDPEKTSITVFAKTLSNTTVFKIDNNEMFLEQQISIW